MSYLEVKKSENESNLKNERQAGGMITGSERNMRKKDSLFALLDQLDLEYRFIKISQFFY